jgi:DNA-binding transcriptional ArsR family regulator
MPYRDVLFVLADPTRRTIFERLRAGPTSVGALAAQVPVSRPAVSQHLKALKTAGLVCERPQGTRRLYAIRREGLVELRDWLESFDQKRIAELREEAEEVAS